MALLIRPPFRHLVLSTILLILAAALPHFSFAYDEDLVDPGQVTFRDPIGDTFHEQIDPYIGHLDLAYKDLHLPGDGGLDLEIVRTYKSVRVTDTALVDRKLGYGWDIQFGLVKKSGNFVNIELHDGTTSTAVRESLGSNYFYTKDFWKLYMPIGGTPVLQLTDGTTITYGHSSTLGYMATEIKKNNNAITITYDGFYIDQVSYKAGGSTKTVTFHYASTTKGHLTSITWGSPSRQIIYSYPSDDNAISTVALPGGDVWKYTHKQQSINLRSAIILEKVTTPWGGTVTYTFDTFGKSIGLGTKTQGSVASKQVSGRGLTNGIWTYDYDVASGYDTTTITDSCNRTTTYSFYGYGSSYNGDCYKYGLMVSKVVMNGSNHEITTEYTWDKLDDSLAPISHTVYALCTDVNATYVPVLSSEVTTRGGKSYTTEYSNFDDYGSPKTIVEQGTNTKTTTIGYWYDTTRNIVKDKPVSVTVAGDSTFPGTFTSTYSYYTNASSDSNYYGELKTASPNGVSTTYAYNSNGNISSVTDANGHVVSYLWSNGSVSKITNPYYAVNRSINWDGTIASETNGRSYTTSYDYDAAMRLTEIDPPVGNTITKDYEYDGSGYFTSVKEQRGSFYTRTSYDGLGRKTGTTNSLGVTTSIAYSSCGLKTATSSNIGDTTSFDHFGRPTSISHLDGASSIAFSYPDDLRMQVTDEAGYTTNKYYKSFGSPDSVLLSEIVDAKSQSIKYSYNILGSLRQASGLDRTDSYGYNSKNFLTSETHPESGTTTFTRDGIGNLKTIQDSLGTRTYTYDNINRLRSIAGSGKTHSYTYDNADNLDTSTSPDSSADYTHDAANRQTKAVTSTKGITSTVSYGYDGNDNLTTITYPNSLSVIYTYNSLNQVTGVSGFGGNIHGITYSTTGADRGLMKQYTRSNSQVASFSYDGRRRPARYTYPDTDQGYNFDARGNLSDWYNYEDRSKDKSFGYDKLNRLTDFDGPWGNGAYSYNASGDRTQKVIGSQTTSYSYSNHLYSGSNYDYNGDGDMTQKGNLSLSYDAFHQMVSASSVVNPFSASYGYDATKKRVFKKVDNSTTLYVYGQGDNVLTELAEDGTPLVNYVYLGNTLISKITYNRLGDILRDGKINLTDVILGLHVVTGKSINKPITVASDLGDDKAIGLSETVYGLGVVAGIDTASGDELFFYDTDYQGTPYSLVDNSGDVVWQVDELPFGEEYQDTGIADMNKRRYIGKEKDDETGLLYFIARYMTGPDGRFNSTDPVGLVNIGTGEINSGNLSNPQRLNRYAYGLNNPYSYVDPDGNDPHRWPDGNYSDNDGQAHPGLSAQVNKAYSQVGQGIAEGWQYHPAVIIGVGLEGAGLRLALSSARSFKSFRAFKAVFGAAGKGRAWHHIVEQTPANLKRFGAELIHNTKNLVNIPHGKGSLHAKISGYYSSKQPFTGGKTVRQWLSSKSYKEQHQFGMKVLKKFREKK